MPDRTLPDKTENAKKTHNARAATIDQILANVVPLFLDPPPSRDTLRHWLDQYNVPRFKANPQAKRGGGPCYYSVAGAEKVFRGLLPGRLAPVEVVL